MFGFMRKAHPTSPSAAIRRVVDQYGLPPRISSSSMLRVVESHGRYAGRNVLYVRVFDPARAAEIAVTVQRFSDLDSYPSLVLWSGHVERDGMVAITRATAPEIETPTRSPADRSTHADDERFVFHGRDSVAPGVTS
jgi:hypothetical protein